MFDWVCGLQVVRYETHNHPHQPTMEYLDADLLCRSGIIELVNKDKEIPKEWKELIQYSCHKNG